MSFDPEPTEYQGKSRYSEDNRYRWWYESRWGPGDSLCWVIGEQTDWWIREMTQRSAVTLAAWGNGGSLLGRGAKIAVTLPDPLCLGTNQNGEPKHPARLASAIDAVPYRP